MAENDLVIVGHPMAVVLYKPPNPIPPDKLQIMTVITVLGPHDDGFVLAILRHDEIPELREAGAEIIVLDADANRFAVRAQESSKDELEQFVAERVQEHNSEIAVAENARDRQRGSDGGSSTT